jgi:hypothetical protein
VCNKSSESIMHGATIKITQRAVCPQSSHVLSRVKYPIPCIWLWGWEGSWRNSSVRMVSVPAETWTRHLKNTNQRCYCKSQLLLVSNLLGGFGNASVLFRSNNIPINTTRNRFPRSSQIYQRNTILLKMEFMFGSETVFMIPSGVTSICFWRSVNEFPIFFAPNYLLGYFE